MTKQVISIVSIVFFICLGIYWISGGEFERSPALAWTVVMSMAWSAGLVWFGYEEGYIK